MKWDTVLDPGAVYLNQVGGQGLLLGSRSCMVDGATGYKISFDMLLAGPARPEPSTPACTSGRPTTRSTRSASRTRSPATAC
jgi:hypothetical protein